MSKGTQTEISGEHEVKVRENDMVNDSVSSVPTSGLSGPVSEHASLKNIIDMDEVMSCDLNESENFEVILDDEGFNEDGNFEHVPSDEDIDGEEENVELSPGEVIKRKLEKMVPDENGFFDCNPEDVALCPVEIRDRRYRLRRGVTADSGAGDPVMPRRMVNPKLIKPSAGSRRGLHYVSATNHRIPNQGEVKMEFKTDEGHQDSIVFQVADVNKALMSISDRVDNQCRVVFDQDDNTGEDLTHIFNKRTKKKMGLKRVGKVWILDCTVAADFLAESSTVFNRPGP